MPKPHMGVGVGKEKQVSLKEYSQATTQISALTRTHKAPGGEERNPSRIAALYYLGCPIKKKNTSLGKKRKYDSHIEENRCA